MKRFLKDYYYILLPIGITILMLLTCPLYFGSDDDTYMMEIAASNVQGSENVVCMSVLFGYLFKLLFTILPAVNWYVVILLAVVNISMITLHKAVKDNGSQIFAVGMLAVIQSYIMMRLTFTGVAFICCTSAVIWVMHKVTKLDKKSIIYFCEAFLLFLAGFGIRRGNLFICVFLLFVPYYFFAVVQKRNSISTIIVLLAVCTVANYTVKELTNYYRDNIPQETYFNQFNEYRAKVTDEGLINYKVHEAEYTEAGISQNDASMLGGFLYGDKSVFSRDMMKTVEEIKDINDRYLFNPLELAQKMVRKPFIWWYLMSMALALIVLKKSRKEVLSISLFVMAAILYLFVRRRGVARVISQISISGMIMLTFVAMRELKGKFTFAEIKQNKIMVAVIVCLFAISPVLTWGYHVLRIKPSLEQREQVMEYIDAHPENVYVCSAIDRMKYAFAQHRLTLTADSINIAPVYNINGNWFLYTPYWYSNLDKLGLSEYSGNTFNALLEPNVMYLSSKEFQMHEITTFLHEHYDIDAEFKLIKSFDNNPLGLYALVKND